VILRAQWIVMLGGNWETGGGEKRRNANMLSSVILHCTSAKALVY